MAASYAIPVTAAQVGTYFVGKYYQVLEQQPDVVHQFYSDVSTMIRTDGTTRETATAMLQIHTLVMSLNYTGYEIKLSHSMESWNGGVLVMVSGSLQMKSFTGRRKFVQTFFLAPQETGYFVLNDIFHFIDDDPVHQYPAVILAHNNLDAKHSAPTTMAEPVSNYLLGGEIQTRESIAPAVKENGPVENFGYVDHRLEQVVETENFLDDRAVEQSNGLVQNAVNTIKDQLPASVEESIGEPQKQTYASILRVAKGQPAPSVAPQNSTNKGAPPASEWNNYPQAAQQPISLSHTYERPVAETTDEVAALEDDDEIKSVYVRNLPPTVSPSEVEEEFVNFGKLKQPEGVVIRSRKDVGVCYAFVEFEDISGVRNAVKAGSVQVGGRQVYIEERRPNSHIPSRVARRGRGRGSYQSEAPRSHFVSRSFGRGGSYDGGDQEDYSRPRGNGYYRPSARQDRGNPGYQPSRNGQSSSDFTD